MQKSRRNLAVALVALALAWAPSKASDSTAAPSSWGLCTLPDGKVIAGVNFKTASDESGQAAISADQKQAGQALCAQFAPGAKLSSDSLTQSQAFQNSGSFDLKSRLEKDVRMRNLLYLGTIKPNAKTVLFEPNNLEITDSQPLDRSITQTYLTQTDLAQAQMTSLAKRRTEGAILESESGSTVDPAALYNQNTEAKNLQKLQKKEISSSEEETNQEKEIVPQENTTRNRINALFQEYEKIQQQKKTLEKDQGDLKGNQENRKAFETLHQDLKKMLVFIKEKIKAFYTFGDQMNQLSKLSPYAEYKFYLNKLESIEKLTDPSLGEISINDLIETYNITAMQQNLLKKDPDLAKMVDVLDPTYTNSIESIQKVVLQRINFSKPFKEHQEDINYFIKYQGTIERLNSFSDYFKNHPKEGLKPYTDSLQGRHSSLFKKESSIKNFIEKEFTGDYKNLWQKYENAEKEISALKLDLLLNPLLENGDYQGSTDGTLTTKQQKINETEKETKEIQEKVKKLENEIKEKKQKIETFQESKKSGPLYESETMQEFIQDWKTIEKNQEIIKEGKETAEEIDKKIEEEKNKFLAYIFDKDVKKEEAKKYRLNKFLKTTQEELDALKIKNNQKAQEVQTMIETEKSKLIKMSNDLGIKQPSFLELNVDTSSSTNSSKAKDLEELISSMEMAAKSISSAVDKLEKEIKKDEEVLNPQIKNLFMNEKNLEALKKEIEMRQADVARLQTELSIKNEINEIAIKIGAEKVFETQTTNTGTGLLEGAALEEAREKMVQKTEEPRNQI
jgi:hypothetical protein